MSRYDILSNSNSYLFTFRLTYSVCLLSNTYILFNNDREKKSSLKVYISSMPLIVSSNWLFVIFLKEINCI